MKKMDSLFLDRTGANQYNMPTVLNETKRKCVESSSTERILPDLRSLRTSSSMRIADIEMDLTVEVPIKNFEDEGKQTQPVVMLVNGGFVFVQQRPKVFSTCFDTSNELTSSRKLTAEEAVEKIARQFGPSLAILAD